MSQERPTVRLDQVHYRSHAARQMIQLSKSRRSELARPQRSPKILSCCTEIGELAQNNTAGGQIPLTLPTNIDNFSKHFVYSWISTPRSNRLLIRAVWAQRVLTQEGSLRGRFGFRRNLMHFVSSDSARKSAFKNSETLFFSQRNLVDGQSRDEPPRVCQIRNILK